MKFAFICFVQGRDIQEIWHPDGFLEVRYPLDVPFTRAISEIKELCGSYPIAFIFGDKCHEVWIRQVVSDCPFLHCDEKKKLVIDSLCRLPRRLLDDAIGASDTAH